MFSAIRRRKKLADIPITLALAFAVFMIVPAAQALAAGTATVTIEGTGSGEVVNIPSVKGFFSNWKEGSPALACSYVSPGPAAGTCTNELAHPESNPEGEMFKAVATPGSAFKEWKIVEGNSWAKLSGEETLCNSYNKPLSEPEQIEGEGRSCVVFNELSTGGGNENVTLTAVFAPAVPLTVFIAGKGKIEGAGLTCASAEECKGEYPENGTVTLTEAAETGYTFAGWLGCRHVTATTCEVTMSAAEEVTAVFMAEGKEGVAGKEGPAGKEGLAGKEGAAGQAGPAGKEGVAGKEGAAGKAGANGAQGPAGVQGPAGPAGRDAKVTCTVKQKGKKVKVTCIVKLLASAGAARVHWRLTRGGHTYAHGASRGSSRLRLNLGLLAKGRYLLHVQGSGGGTAIVVG